MAGKVLVICAKNRALIQDNLELQGFTVRFADGVSYLSASMGDFQPDIVIYDQLIHDPASVSNALVTTGAPFHILSVVEARRSLGIMKMRPKDKKATLIIVVVVVFLYCAMLSLPFLLGQIFGGSRF